VPIVPLSVGSALCSVEEHCVDVSLQYLEDAYPEVPIEVKQIIATSFLLDLPWPDEPGSGIAAGLGSVLTVKFGEVRPAG
jgi:hypothetical protein